MGDRPTHSNGKERIRSYRDLAVWREAMDLVTEVYALTRRFPDDERFGLSSQVRRAAVSVASNVAEGWGRGRTSEYVQFLRYARGSLHEVETQLLIAEHLIYVSGDDVASILERGDQLRLGRMLRSLIRTLEQRTPA